MFPKNQTINDTPHRTSTSKVLEETEIKMVEEFMNELTII